MAKTWWGGENALKGDSICLFKKWTTLQDVESHYEIYDMFLHDWIYTNNKSIAQHFC